jgi:putative spermidine/putrescine transport system ATP-binding protein
MINVTRPGNLLLDKLCKRYGSTTAVDGLDLAIAPGEFVTLLGPSGSGKTSTLALIAGFQRPSGGRIIMDSIDVTNVPPHRRNIGVVFQHYALFPHMSVWENIAFPLKRRGMNRAALIRRVNDTLAMVRLEGLGDRHPRQLSGGQQQRVALARAIVFQPPLLLMDEPLSALDRGLRQNMQAEIRRIHRDLGSTVLYVTHDQEEALALSDRIALMLGGRIEQCGSPASIYEHPNTAFAARFMGESNFFRGKVADILTDMIEVSLANGITVRGRAACAPKRGDDVLVVIRPEDLIINPTEAINHSVIEACVDEVTYLGSSLRVQGRIANGDNCIFYLPKSERRPVSERLRLAWSTAVARVILAT